MVQCLADLEDTPTLLAIGTCGRQSVLNRPPLWGGLFAQFLQAFVDYGRRLRFLIGSTPLDLSVQPVERVVLQGKSFPRHAAQLRHPMSQGCNRL